MGRKPGGKNFGNFTEAPVAAVAVKVTEMERHDLPNIFTSITKDFISVRDLMDSSGLSYDTCTKIIREIKAISDVFGIVGFVHRTDYYLYLSRRMRIDEHKNVVAGN